MWRGRRQVLLGPSVPRFSENWFGLAQWLVPSHSVNSRGCSPLAKFTTQAQPWASCKRPRIPPSSLEGQGRKTEEWPQGAARTQPKACLYSFSPPFPTGKSPPWSRASPTLDRRQTGWESPQGPCHVLPLQLSVFIVSTAYLSPQGSGLQGCLLAPGALQFAVSPWLILHSFWEFREEPDHIRGEKEPSVFGLFVLHTPSAGESERRFWGWWALFLPTCCQFSGRNYFGQRLGKDSTCPFALWRKAMSLGKGSNHQTALDGPEMCICSSHTKRP